MSKIEVSSIADASFLAFLWRKRLRKVARAHPLAEFYLGHDALENLAFEWDLARITKQLAASMRTHSYRAESPVFVRGAKTVGLTRPIAHLRFSDTLAYRAIVTRAENSLANATPPWARMGRPDEEDGGHGGESGWFRAWLERQRKIWVMADNFEWLVESDISTYFPTIGIPQVCDHVRSESNLSDEAVRLLRHMLSRFSPMVEYRTLPAGGLAQEFSDSSRVLAHGYLSTLDHAFEQEGQANGYTRWVDDIIVGAHTWPEAVRIVKRIQLELEKLGLYPNASKTRIYRRSDFVIDYMKAENDFIGDIEVSKSLSDAERREFRRRLQAHVELTPPRPKAWARVLRRYYTNSRRLREQYLMGHWSRHLTESPESAGHILEYVRSHPLTIDRVRSLGSVLSQFGGVYEDLEILAMETLATAPVGRDAATRSLASALALARIKGSTQYGSEVAAAAMVAVAKLGVRWAMSDLRAMTPEIMKADSPVRRQLLPIALGLHWIDQDDIRAAGFDGSDEAVWQVEFLMALSAGDKRALDMTFGVLKPTQRKHPSRWVVRSRLAFLAPIAARADRSRYALSYANWCKQLESNSPDLRDYCLEGWLRFARVQS